MCWRSTTKPIPEQNERWAAVETLQCSLFASPANKRSKLRFDGEQFLPHTYDAFFQLAGKLFVSLLRRFRFGRRVNRIAEHHLQWHESLKRFPTWPSLLK